MSIAPTSIAPTSPATRPPAKPARGPAARCASTATLTPRDAGFTLIEVVVAIAILSLGAVASFQSMAQSTRLVGERTARTLALVVAQNRAEELRLLGAAAGRGLPSEVEMGPIGWTVEQREETTEVGLVQVEIRVTAPDRPGARLVVFVPPDGVP